MDLFSKADIDIWQTLFKKYPDVMIALLKAKRDEYLTILLDVFFMKAKSEENVLKRILTSLAEIMKDYADLRDFLESNGFGEKLKEIFFPVKTEDKNGQFNLLYSFGDK